MDNVFYFPAKKFCFPIGETQFPNFPELSLHFPGNSHEFSRFPNDSPWFPSFLCSFQYNFTSVYCLWALGLFYAYYMYLWKWEFDIMHDKEL